MQFELDIPPKPQKRARHKKFGVYKDSKQRINENATNLLLLPHKPLEPLAGPLRLHVAALMPIPKSWTLRRKQAAAAGIAKPTGKNDLDNLLKHIMDCLTQMQFWHDDGQVVEISASKFYSNTPKWCIEIEEIKQ